jgi:hypothetical protein
MFERNLRPRLIPRACLLERPFILHQVDLVFLGLPWLVCSVGSISLMLVLSCATPSSGLDLDGLGSVVEQKVVGLFWNMTSGQARLPAEFKHITKRRKRN